MEGLGPWRDERHMRGMQVERGPGCEAPPGVSTHVCSLTELRNKDGLLLKHFGIAL